MLLQFLSMKYSPELSSSSHPVNTADPPCHSKAVWFELTSPALQGGFLTTGPPGKSPPVTSFYFFPAWDSKT